MLDPRRLICSHERSAVRCYALPSLRCRVSRQRRDRRLETTVANRSAPTTRRRVKRYPMLRRMTAHGTTTIVELITECPITAHVITSRRMTGSLFIRARPTIGTYRFAIDNLWLSELRAAMPWWRATIIATTLSIVTTPSTAITRSSAITTIQATPRRVIRTRLTGAWRSAARQGSIASRVPLQVADDAEVGNARAVLQYVLRRPTGKSDARRLWATANIGKLRIR